MKLLRVQTLLLALALSACSVPGLPPQRSAAGVEPLTKAYNALMDRYVDPPDPAVLLDAAYKAARQLVVDQAGAAADLQPPTWTQGRAANFDSFAKAYRQLESKYGGMVGADKLEYAALQAMAASLKDCLTRFYDPSAVTARQAEVTGQQQFGGIGVLMKNLPGHPTILRVLDGPALAAGLKPGDEIVAVDGQPVTGKTFEQVRNSIRGPQGSKVKISVKRSGTDSTLDFELARGQIQAPIFDAAVLGGSIGYLHIYSFPRAQRPDAAGNLVFDQKAGILAQIDSSLEVMDQQRVSSVIVDVRSNTGGDQETIMAALGRFVRSGTVEIQVERGGERKPFAVDGSAFWRSPKPLVLLTDEDTQSGGEMFAKAMQEEGGYRVVGAPTAGCAGSARTFELGDGSTMEITTGKILSGRGEEINRVGVKPDQQVAYPLEDLAAGRDPQLGAALQLQSSGAIGESAAASPRPSASGVAQSSAAPVGEAPQIVKPVGGPAGAPNQPLPIIK